MDELQAGITTVRKNIINLIYVDDNTLMAEGEEELKNLLMRVKEESERASLRLNTKKKTNITASAPITAWQIEGGKVEAVTYFFFLGSQITVDGDCSHKIRRQMLLGRKVLTNLDSMLKSRDITLPTKICIVKAMVFSVVTYGCESWITMKADHQRIDTFQPWCWRRRLRVVWTER